MSVETKASAEQLRVANDVANAFDALPMVNGAALSGSISRGFDDEISDVDVSLYCKGSLPSEKQCADILDELDVELAIPDTVQYSHESLGVFSFFTYDGTDVDLRYRRIDDIAERLEQFVEAEDTQPRRAIHEAAYGYYLSADANAVDECEILFERDDCISDLKSKIETYPEVTKRQIVEKHLEAARSLIDRKLQKQARRGDFYHFDAVSARCLRSIVLALFALNEVYFPGDKWVGAYIDQFDQLPECYESNVAEYRRTPDADATSMERKVQLLDEIVRELEQLAAENVGYQRE